MPLPTSLLLVGLTSAPAGDGNVVPRMEWHKLSLTPQVEPVRVQLLEGFALKPDRMLTKACLTMVHGLAGGTPLDPVTLLPERF